MGWWKKRKETTNQFVKNLECKTICHTWMAGRPNSLTQIITKTCIFQKSQKNVKPPVQTYKQGCRVVPFRLDCIMMNTSKSRALPSLTKFQSGMLLFRGTVFHPMCWPLGGADHPYLTGERTLHHLADIDLVMHQASLRCLGPSTSSTAQWVVQICIVRVLVVG